MNPGPLAVRNIDPAPLSEVLSGKTEDRIKLAVAAASMSYFRELKHKLLVGEKR